MGLQLAEITNMQTSWQQTPHTKRPHRHTTTNAHDYSVSVDLHTIHTTPSHGERGDKLLHRTPQKPRGAGVDVPQKGWEKMLEDPVEPRGHVVFAITCQSPKAPECKNTQAMAGPSAITKKSRMPQRTSSEEPPQKRAAHDTHRIYTQVACTQEQPDVQESTQRALQTDSEGTDMDTDVVIPHTHVPTVPQMSPQGRRFMAMAAPGNQVMAECDIGCRGA